MKPDSSVRHSSSPPGSGTGDVCAVIVAAGRGLRMNTEIPKQYLPLDGKPVLAHSIGAFLDCPHIDRIVVVVARDDVERFENSVLSRVSAGKPLAWVEGGDHRGESVYRGLQFAGGRTGIVVIHDGVRPLIRPAMIGRVVAVAKEKGACILAAKAIDTLKRVDENGCVRETLDRSRIWTAQTPQAFPFFQIRDAHEKARAQGIAVTDDAQLLERLNLPVHIVEGDPSNLKITTARDLQVAEALLAAGNG
ncbi:MAG: 2-C-methyl-D-erythritol 4-phosphate cytidylyltransferase [Desulfobacterales bacterium]